MSSLFRTHLPKEDSHHSLTTPITTDKNCWFAERKWTNNIVTSQGQKISFCCMNAHHQNCVAECRIRELTEHTHTMLVHAQHRWPRAISANFWPYTLRTANNILNPEHHIQSLAQTLTAWGVLGHQGSRRFETVVSSLWLSCVRLALAFGY